MVNKPKAKGTAAETRVVNYLLAAGLEARRLVLKGSKDQGDVFVVNKNIGSGDRIIEVKAGRQTINVSRKQLDEWIDEATDEGINAGGYLGFLVIAKHGASVRDYQVWHAMLTVNKKRDFMYLDEFARELGGRPE